MIVAISHLILEMLEIKRKKRVDEIRAIQEREKLIQDQQKKIIERDKYNLQAAFSVFPDFKNVMKDWIKNPDKMVTFYKDIKELNKKSEEIQAKLDPKKEEG